MSNDLDATPLRIFTTLHSRHTRKRVSDSRPTKDFPTRSLDDNLRTLRTGLVGKQGGSKSQQLRAAGQLSH